VSIRHEENLHMFHDLAGLDAEWSRLSDSSDARTALWRWGLTQPALRGLASLDDVLARRQDPAVAPGVLSALATLAPTDRLAARTLLQALVPGLLRLAGSAGYDDPVAMAEMLSLAWERIRTYPSTRPGSVAGNVLLDVRKDYRRHRDLDAPRSSLELVATGARERSVPSAEDQVVDRMAFVDLLAAHRKAVGDRGHRAIVRTAVDGLSLAEVAAEANVCSHTIAQRRFDARARVRRLALAE
jgi:DNA-directed RNA polymerase specialized sigma24 family protein